MKIRHILASTLLAGFAALGLAAGLKAAPVREAKALGEHYAYLDLRRVAWENSEAKFAICYQDDGAGEEWSDFFSATATEHIFKVELPASLTITPTKAFVVRMGPESVTPEWAHKYNQFNVTTEINRTYVAQAYSEGEGASAWDHGWNTSQTFVTGGSVGNWSINPFSVELTGVNFTGTQDIELTGEVTMASGTDFKVFTESTSFGKYELDSTVSGYFSGPNTQEGNIACSQAGTYKVFFKYDQKTLYITSAAAVAADGWAKYFLDNVGCDATGVELPTGWSDVASKYAELSDDAKNLAYGYVASESGNNLAKALARYDHAVSAHSTLEKFVKNAEGTVRSSGSFRLDSFNSNNTYGSAVVIFVASITVAIIAAGSVLILRRRKEN